MIEDIMPTNELGAAEKRYELRKRFFVEFASVASNTADIEYLSALRLDLGIDKCNRVFHLRICDILPVLTKSKNESLSKYSENDSFTRRKRPIINNLLYICNITTIFTP